MNKTWYEQVTVDAFDELVSHSPERVIDLLITDVQKLKVELGDVHNDACFYKSCALSGEVPAEGCQPSAVREAKEQGE